jgi:hypothetical protein
MPFTESPVRAEAPQPSPLAVACNTKSTATAESLRDTGVMADAKSAK